jgi:hypothetical protein
MAVKKPTRHFRPWPWELWATYCGGVVRKVHEGLRTRWQFPAALALAPLYWLGLAQTRSLSPDLAWPLAQPVPFLLVAVVYPIFEEAVFRGLIQGVLVRRPWGAKVVGGLSMANLLAALLFAAGHLWQHTAWHALAVLPMGLLFGHFRDRYGGIARPVLLHIAYNTGNAWLFGGAS